MNNGNLRRREILRALGELHPMTVRQLGAKIGLSSTSSVQAHIESLHRYGLIRHICGWELTASGKAAIDDAHPTRQHWEARK